MFAFLVKESAACDGSIRGHYRGRHRLSFAQFLRNSSSGCDRYLEGGIFPVFRVSSGCKCNDDSLQADLKKQYEANHAITELNTELQYRAETSVKVLLLIEMP